MSRTEPSITASEENISSQEDFEKGPEKTYSVVFNEASKGFASMADELAKNKKFNKNHPQNSDFVAPKLKPVDPNNSKTQSAQSGEKRKTFTPLPSQKSLEKDEGENKRAEEQTPKTGVIHDCILLTPFIG